MLNTSLKGTETRDELSITLYLQSESKINISVRMPDATSLHHCLQNYHQYCTMLS